MNYDTPAATGFYPMITKNTMNIMDSKDCMYIGGRTYGKFYSASGENISNPCAYATTLKPIYNNRAARGANLNAKTRLFFVNNTAPKLVPLALTEPARPCYMQRDSLDVLMTHPRAYDVYVEPKKSHHRAPSPLHHARRTGLAAGRWRYVPPRPL